MRTKTINDLKNISSKVESIKNIHITMFEELSLEEKRQSSDYIHGVFVGLDWAMMLVSENIEE
ncbi:MAG: hypothetical protein ACRCTJ_03970 [Brevinema sp.]